VVDAERGVVLRLASRLGGEDFDALEVEEIRFDGRFGQEVFDSREPLPWRQQVTSPIGELPRTPSA
jgi:hypothetical protein